MINKTFFKQEIQKLVTEYSDKGFTMSKERAEQWYSYFKEFDEKSFSDAISTTLKGNSYAPSMADVYKYIAAEHGSYGKLLPGGGVML